MYGVKEIGKKTIVCESNKGIEPITRITMLLVPSLP